MNIPNLLAASPTLDDLRGYALILSAELSATFAQVQVGLGQRQFTAQARKLTDGRFMLGADLLSEIHEGGLYHEGFAVIPPELLGLVEVVAMAEVLPLLPVIEPTPPGQP